MPSGYIAGPCIIDSGAEIRHCAFIRGNAIVGKNSVVGNSTELKNVEFEGVMFEDDKSPCMYEGSDGEMHQYFKVVFYLGAEK